MNPPVFLSIRSARAGREGVALILVLAILALLSILLVSFVSMAAHDRGATQSYGKSMQADQTALGGLDFVVAQIQAEIADPALSTNSATSGASPLYIPLGNTNAVPQRMTPKLIGIATLIGYSGTNLYTVGAGVTNYSSGSSTLNNSLNGRVISTSRWNKPQLMTDTTSFPTPQWILVTRAGPRAFSSYNASMADSTPLNAGYVSGRFAYTIYDTSGLIDANVAGYPSTTTPASSITGKGLLPWADLTQLSSTVTQSDVDTLVAWRNASSSASYASYVSSAATNNGFTRVANGDTTFLSRQELIKYAQTQVPHLASALPYLTTFSRELNGPTWGPATNAAASGTYAYALSQYTPESINPRIPNPRVQAVFTRDNGLQAVVGEPLVKYRFPLDKLALLEKFMGTGTGGLSAADITNIQKYFGLDLATDNPNGPSYRHWIYPTTSTTYKHGVLSGTTGIMTLDDVAAENREPDFFELLQAGILSGSLGVPGKNTSGYPNSGRYDKWPLYNPTSSSTTSFVDPDDSATLQILRIGANIIDQWDADSFPTTITYSNQGAPVSVYGIEDLPYPYAAYFNFYAANVGQTGGTSGGPYTTPLPPFNYYLYFSLWNPHQQAASVNAANYPAHYRFFPFYNSTENANFNATCCDSFVAGFQNGRTVAKPGTGESWFYNGTASTPNGSNGNHNYLLMKDSAPAGIPFTYSPTSSTSGYREPILAQGANVGGACPPALSNYASLVLPPLTNFPNGGKTANNDGNTGFPTNTAVGAGSPNGAWQTQFDVRFVMPVQYQDAANTWHTYSTFVGVDDQSGAYAAGTYCEGYTPYGVTPPPTNFILSCPLLMKSDPRTSRFGVGAGGSGTNQVVDVNVPASSTNGMVAGVTMPPISTAPFVGATSNYRLDLWADNDGSTPATSRYGDTDGVQRQGDARNSIGASNPTSPLFAGAMANRPIVLNRPFQSVGELGYVYRDMPWKTLDLSSSNSPDSGLLDLFTLSDAPMLAGRVNPNTPYPQVLAALLSGNTQSTANGTLVASGNATAIGQAITNTTSPYPFMTRADLINNFMTNSTVTGTLAPSGIKTEEETVARAIAESSNTRTWNFMIDVIAQSGRYPVSATGSDNFVVEGERRYWLHVAIDRYTGQVVDKQLEVVNE